MTFRLTGRHGMEEVLKLDEDKSVIISIDDESNELRMDFRLYGFLYGVELTDDQAFLISAALSRASWRHTKQDSHGETKDAGGA